MPADAMAARFKAIAWLLAAGVLLHIPSPAAATSQPEQGAQLAAICAACHRLDGKTSSAPSIVGRKPAKLAADMAAFRSGKGENQIMHAVALSLSDDETATLARYLAGLGGEP